MALGEGMEVLSVSEALSLVGGVVKKLPRLVIEGEVSGSKPPKGPRGHLYFDVKDDGASMPVTIWGGRDKLDFQLRDGMKVRLIGCFQVYEPWGRLSFIADTAEPAGEGLLRAQVAALARRLQSEGLMFPSIGNVIVADTSFHYNIPEKAYRYALPRDVVDKLHIRKYGAHGTSHRFIWRATDKFTGGHTHRLVSCHLGSGASLAAIKDGKDMDTTMGLTPLDGLIMGTRCGSIDPATVCYLQRVGGYSIDEVDTMMNKQSGLLALSGISSDSRDIELGADDGDRNCRMALEMFYYRTSQLVMAKRFYILLYLFLSRTYKNVEVVYIRHHTQAKEVDEHAPSTILPPNFLSL